MDEGVPPNGVAEVEWKPVDACSEVPKGEGVGLPKPLRLGVLPDIDVVPKVPAVCEEPKVLMNELELELAPMAATPAPNPPLKELFELWLPKTEDGG